MDDFREKAKMPHPVDIHVGRRVRKRRVELGFSQAQLAPKLGVIYQQLHKYECGSNRVSASRLFQIAQVLGVTPSFFFDGYEPPTTGRWFAEPPAKTADADLMRLRGAVKLVKRSIDDPALRGNPHPIDIHVGRRVSERRAELGFSREWLAAELGVGYHQVWKYELAVNRISAGRLFDIAKLFDVEPSFFFEGYEPPATRPRVRRTAGRS